MVAPSTTATDWLRRWDAQQQGHIPDREERFAAITESLAAHAGERPRVLDLGSGPGSLSARVLQRLPGSQVVAVDTDPVLLRIGREALAGDRVQFVDADLRGEWDMALPAGPPFDAAVSTTALHWLKLTELLPFYRRLATVLRPGGVFLDGDRFDFDHDQRQIAASALTARESWPAAPPGQEGWDEWWAAIEADAGYAGEVEQRRARHHEHPHDHEHHTYEFHRTTLLAAGFTEVGTVWQRFVNRVLIAIR